jgi:hypothetical protein
MNNSNEEGSKQSTLYYDVALELLKSINGHAS